MRTAKRLIAIVSVAVAALTGAAQAAGWQYIEEKDEMRGVTNKWAAILSDNEVNLGAYRVNMGRLRLDIRSMPQQYGTDVILTVPTGQIHCRHDGCRIPMKFDDGKIITYTADVAADGNSSVFIREKDGFIRRARKASKIIIEIPVWRRGSEQFTFTADGLSWK